MAFDLRSDWSNESIGYIARKACGLQAHGAYRGREEEVQICWQNSLSCSMNAIVIHNVALPRATKAGSAQTERSR
jgi:hypothetical protein